jgi:hypothetical protein
MIIVCSSCGDIDVFEPLDFKRFSFRARRDQVLVDSPFVTFEDQSVAWVSEAGLRAWGEAEQAPGWQDGLTAMIAFARAKGWMDSAGERIRAHIDWVA